MRPPARSAALPAATAVLATATAVLLAGCGRPPEPPDSPVPPASASPPSGAPTAPSPIVPGSPRSPGATFGAEVAVGCGGQPDVGAVLAVLRDADELAPETNAEVIEGPLCAGSWQYAVVSVPDLDPLLVLTRGPPDALELVTAGTEVCSPEVEVTAPPGIREVAGCVG